MQFDRPVGSRSAQTAPVRSAVDRQVPDGVGCRPKWLLALEMLQRAKGNKLRGVVLADSLFGSVTKFRQALDAESWRYCVGVDSTLKVIAADADLGPVPPKKRTGRPPTRPVKVRAGARSSSVRQWAESHVADFREVTWRHGVGSRFHKASIRTLSQRLPNSDNGNISPVGCHCEPSLRHRFDHRPLRRDDQTAGRVARQTDQPS